MPGKRYTAEQKIRLLREAERLKRGLADEMLGEELLREAKEPASVPGCWSSWPMAFLRHCLELLYHLEQLIDPARLT